MKNILVISLVFATFVSCSTNRQQVINKKNKVIIAHRGASGYLPEHTLEGAAMAHSWGVDFIEPDVVLTKDNVAVVLHDHHIDTTTDVARKFPKRKRSDGRYYAIDFTLKEIKKLNVYERFDLKSGKNIYSKRFPVNQQQGVSNLFKVPTLSEFIEFVQSLNKSTGKRIGIYPELKHPEFHTKNGKDIAKIVLRALRRYGYEQKSKHGEIFIQCFFPPTLIYLREGLKTSIPLVLLIADNEWKESSYNYELLKTKEGLAKISSYINGIGPWVNHIFKPKGEKGYEMTSLVNIAHELGLKVHPYTARKDSLPVYADSFTHLLSLLFDEAKVDGVFTDFGIDVIENLK